eukprot:2540790-Pyramimonas_sp.AAC.1
MEEDKDEEEEEEKAAHGKLKAHQRGCNAPVFQGSDPLEKKVRDYLDCARTVVLECKRRESLLMLRLDDPESCLNAIPGTSTQRINVTAAP